MKRGSWKRTAVVALVVAMALSAFWAVWVLVTGEIPDSSFRYNEGCALITSRLGDIFVAPLLIFFLRFWTEVIRKANEATIRGSRSIMGMMQVSGGMGWATSAMALTACFVAGSSPALVIAGMGLAIALFFMMLAVIAVILVAIGRRLRKIGHFTLSAF